ncbi:MAG: DUF3119 family protein [Cyanobacteria bacterium]|nr:DUF3119 family protein [Cyanobacteriota bacterium]MDW8200970.1 DUF3119 family protein [Cyanobacteriota bacterium SKYGB_h_bin112]
MTSSSSTTIPSSVTQLAPSYWLPLALIVVAIPMVVVQLWLSLMISLFGLFLMVQAVTLRLCFTSSDLDIYRGNTLIRRFPYSEWVNWRIFWPSVPILFYFREVKSIHFLPILFDPKQLQVCLEYYCPHVD